MTFDWVTFALQLVNVLILLAILRHFLFRPIASIIEKRRIETQTALDTATAAQADAEAAIARARAEADASAAARQELLRKAADEAEAQRAKLIEKARAEAERIVEDGRAARAREEAKVARQAMAEIRDLAAAVAIRAMSAQPDGPIGYAMRLAETLEKMDSRKRDALLGGGDLTIVTAKELSNADLDTVRKALKTYGAAAKVTTDPDLIDGIELRSGTGVLRNSLAHDLETLSKAMLDVQSDS